MRVLHLDSGLHWRGGQEQLFQLAAGLKRYEIEQQLVLREGSVFISRLAELDVSVSQLPLSSEIDVISIARLRQLIKRLQPSILHTHDARTLGLITAARLLGPLPKVVAARRVAFPLGKSPFTRLKYGRVPNRIIAVSKFVKQLLVTAGIDAQSIEVVYDGFDRQRTDLRISRAEARRQFRIPEDVYLIGCVGHFAVEKGHDVLIRGFAEAAAGFPQARLILIGDGELRKNYLRQAEQLRLAERVQFPGFICDLERIWPALDLFVFPSLQEGLGSSLLKAMAHGVPVCASRVGGIPEMVSHGETGYLFRPGDSAALAESLLFALQNVQHTQELGKAASRFVQERFTASHMVEQTYAIYSNVLRC
jgi:glycosyltransferase involved in cell wall biosynthesis